jgi:hypothetical protein
MQMTMSRSSAKTMRDQLAELQKLVLDAQDQLDLAVRGLQILQDQLNSDAESAGLADPDRPTA